MSLTRFQEWMRGKMSPMSPGKILNRSPESSGFSFSDFLVDILSSDEVLKSPEVA